MLLLPTPIAPLLSQCQTSVLSRMAYPVSKSLQENFLDYDFETIRGRLLTCLEDVEGPS